MAKAVFCIAETDFQAERIVHELRIAGFLNSDISALLPDMTGNNDFGNDASGGESDGRGAGAGKGGVLGSACGWLAGMGSLVIPGAGPFVAAGPIMAAVSGAAVGAAVGGIAGALIGMGIPELEARRYEGKIRAGNILISVHTDNPEKAQQVKELFEGCHSQDIAISGEPSVKPTPL